MEANQIDVAEKVSASRKLGIEEATAIAKASTRVIISKGKSVREHSPKGRADDDLVQAMLGATGNLRAPLLRVGKITLVGFDADVYRGVLLG